MQRKRVFILNYMAIRRLIGKYIRVSLYTRKREAEISRMYKVIIVGSLIVGI